MAGKIDIEKLKEKIKNEHTNISDKSESPTTVKFKQRKRGRRRGRVQDKAENIGTNLEPEVLSKTLKSIKPTEDILAASQKQMAKASGKKRYSYNRLNRYIFVDTFGESCAVFFDKKARSFLDKLVDIQMNCIDEINATDGKIWEVYGEVDDVEYYYKVNVKLLGHISCVGISNAMLLAKAMCLNKDYRFSYIQFVNIEGESNGRKR